MKNFSTFRSENQNIAKLRYTLNCKALLFIIFFLLCTGLNNSYAQQGEIISVNPPSAFQGETIHLIIQGSQTGFSSGNVFVNFPDFIEVQSILVNTPELLTLRIKISPEAQEGTHPFTISTSTQTITAEFEVIMLQDYPEAMISILPIQSVSISDYDFENLRNMPLLFSVSVFTAGMEYIRLETELLHEDFGLIASAEKVMVNVGNIFTFDNRQYDSYDITKASDDIIESANGNGVLPPGAYTYILRMYNKNNKQIGGEIIAGFFIPGRESGIDMIGPGVSLETEPDLVYTNKPYFQWFGGFAQYDLTLYEVLDGQLSADEITTNLPVYEGKDITNPSYLYPDYAEILKEGNTYAWQVSSSIFTGSGETKIFSEVYWFIYQVRNDADWQIESLEILPDDAEIFTGDSLQIIVVGINKLGDTIPAVCEWKIIPQHGGSVNAKGLFIAGDTPGIYAIKVDCGRIEDYITITVKSR